MSNIGYVYGYAQKIRYESEQEALRNRREKHFRYISKIAQQSFETSRKEKETQRKLDEAWDELERTCQIIKKYESLY